MVEHGLVDAGYNVRADCWFMFMLETSSRLTGTVRLSLSMIFTPRKYSPSSCVFYSMANIWFADRLPGRNVLRRENLCPVSSAIRCRVRTCCLILSSTPFFRSREVSRWDTKVHGLDQGPRCLRKCVWRRWLQDLRRPPWILRPRGSGYRNLCRMGIRLPQVR